MEEQWMQEALQLAALGLGFTYPNPPVGCLIVQAEEVVGRGYHPKAGEPHAEVFALREAGARAQGATAYVTLEPCSHFGRTPPCADALIEAGIARVYVAALDPNPLVAGRGVERLREAGLEVHIGLCAPEAMAQQAGFRTRICLGRPRVTYKYAQTLDGKIATLSGDSRWVSSPESRDMVHELRQTLDAIAVGSGTVLADDPELNVRLPQPRRQPVRVLFDRSGVISAQARAVSPETVIVTTPTTPTEHLAARGCRFVRAETLSDALQGLGELGLTSMLLEGGPTLAGAFLQAGLIDELWVFIAPKLLGAGRSPLHTPLIAQMQDAIALSHWSHQAVGPDILLRAQVHAIPSLQPLHTIRP